MNSVYNRLAGGGARPARREAESRRLREPKDFAELKARVKAMGYELVHEELIKQFCIYDGGDVTSRFDSVKDLRRAVSTGNITKQNL
jgi:hypothetical protein